MARAFFIGFLGMLVAACTGASAPDSIVVPTPEPPVTEEPPVVEEPPEVTPTDGTITLQGTGETFGSLRAAINAAAAGEVLLLGPGTYREDVLIQVDLTLRGTDGQAATVIEGERRFRPLEIRGATVVLEDLTFLHGSSDPGGAVHAEDARLTVRRCTFGECRSFDRAGAVSIRTSGDASAFFDECVFRDCESGGRGGAVYAAAGAPGEYLSLRFQRCRFLRNDGNAGGALLLSAGFGDARLEATFDRCTFEANHGRDGGGLMAEVGTGEASIQLLCTNCLFVDNTSTGKGSAVRVVALTGSAAVDARILQCTFTANRAPSRAGGYGPISAESPTQGASLLRLENSILFANVPPGVFTSGIEFDATASFIDRDPMFVDPLAHDFRLMPGSPAIDAGETSLLPLDLLLDLDGNPRVVGAHVDVGAYESE